MKVAIAVLMALVTVGCSIQPKIDVVLPDCFYVIDQGTQAKILICDAGAPAKDGG